MTFSDVPEKYWYVPLTVQLAIPFAVALAAYRHGMREGGKHKRVQ
jgi:hypothetical protein